MHAHKSRANMSDTIFNGTYHLVSMENRHASGEVTYPYGLDAKGVISYGPDGYMFVHIMANNRNQQTKSDLFGGDTAEIKHSATTHLSYCGSYEVHDTVVIHRVSICSFPNWVNTEQRREWAFENDQLFLTAYGIPFGNETVDAHLIWQRETGQ